MSFSFSNLPEIFRLPKDYQLYGVLNQLKFNLATFDRWGDRHLLKFVCRHFFKPFQNPNIRHLVVCRTGDIDDTLTAIPALGLIRKAFPHTSITLINPREDLQIQGAREALEAFPGLVDRVISCPAKNLNHWGQLKQLKAEIHESGEIDLWINLPGTLESCAQALKYLLLARWLNCAAVLGFDILLPENFRTVYSRYQSALLPKATDWLISLLQSPLNISDSPSNYLGLFQPNQPWHAEDFGLDATQPMLAVQAGAQEEIKRWPEENFQKVLNHLAEVYPWLQIVLLGNQPDYELNHRLLMRIKGNVTNLSGQLERGQTWSLLAQATAVFGNESEITQMAGLLEKPVFTPLSGQYPSPVWHPPGKTLLEFRKAVPCAPCFEKKCPYKDQICLTLLSPDIVNPALDEVLKALLG